jgi:hypothetical protein
MPRGLAELSVPEFQAEQAEKLTLEIPARSVLIQDALNCLRREDTPHKALLIQQQVSDVRPQVARQPTTIRHWKPCFFAS